MMEPTRRTTIVEDIRRLIDKVQRLERATRGASQTVDAAGAEWAAANPNWIDPATQPEWLELRVSNTDTGNHIFRNCGGQWKRTT